MMASPAPLPAVRGLEDCGGSLCDVFSSACSEKAVSSGSDLVSGEKEKLNQMLIEDETTKDLASRSNTVVAESLLAEDGSSVVDVGSNLGGTHRHGAGKNGELSSINKTRISYSAIVGSGPLVQNHSLVTEIKNGESIGIVPAAVIKEAQPLWTDLLVGRFASKVPNVGRVHGIVSRIWSLGNKDIKIYAYEVNETMIKFRISDARTRERILRRGIWNIAGVLMMLSRWAPAEEKDDTEVKVMPIWVTLKHVPRSMFHWPGLRYLASLVGEPKKLHPETVLCSKFDEGKVLVEVDLMGSMPKTHKFRLPQSQEFTIAYHYPWVLKQCANCQKWGHSKEACVMVQKNDVDVMTTKIDIVKAVGVEADIVAGELSFKQVTVESQKDLKANKEKNVEAQTGLEMGSSLYKDTAQNLSPMEERHIVQQNKSMDCMDEGEFKEVKVLEVAVPTIDAGQVQNTEIGKSLITKEAGVTTVAEVKTSESQDSQVTLASKKEVVGQTTQTKEEGIKSEILAKNQPQLQGNVDGTSIQIPQSGGKPKAGSNSIKVINRGQDHRDFQSPLSGKKVFPEDIKMGSKAGAKAGSYGSSSTNKSSSPIEKLQLEIRSSLLTNPPWGDQIEDYQDENEEAYVATTRSLRIRQSKKAQNKKKQNSNQKSQGKKKENSDKKGNGKKGRRGYK